VSNDLTKHLIMRKTQVLTEGYPGDAKKKHVYYNPKRCTVVFVTTKNRTPINLRLKPKCMQKFSQPET
jgi:hypothetical protein